MQYGPKTMSHFSMIGLNKNNNKKRTSRSFSVLFSVLESSEIALPYSVWGGHYGPPYSFSLISPERLELRPSNFLTFSFYLLAIRKI